MGISLVLALLVNTSSFSDEVIYQYNIPEQSLNNGLVQFAAQSNLELIFAVDKIRGIKGNAVFGEMRRKQALKQLLQGSGFTYYFVAVGTVTIVPQTVIELDSVQEIPYQPNISPRIKVLRPLIILGKNIAFKGERDDSSKAYSITHTKSATRNDTAIREVPQSIQVLTRSLIDDQASLTISESLKNISGVIVGHFQLTPSFEFTSVRGFPAEQLLDGFTQYYNSGDKESLVNIEQIEVLKGSNALLYGGGSGSPAGGLVNIVSKLPQVQAIGEVGINYGSYQFYQPYFDLNQPINEHILLRITGEYTYSESYLDIIETERYNINPALTITDNEATKLILQGKISSWQQVDYQGLPKEGTLAGNFDIRPETFIGPANIEPSNAKFHGVWGTLEHEVNKKIFVSIKARYAQSGFNQKTQLIVGADGFQADKPLLVPSTWSLYNTELFQQQQEVSFAANVLLKSTLGVIENKMLFGVDYSQFKDEGFIDFGVIPIGAVDLSNPEFIKPYSTPGDRVNNILVKNVTYGGYLQLQSTAFNKLHLLAGVRLGHVSIDYKNNALGFEAIAHTKKTKILPRLGATYDLTDDLSWFVSYSEGMRGQPFINFVGSPVPELSRQMETGFKFDFLSSLSGQVAVYQIDRTHVAITDNNNLQQQSVTAGQQRSRGVEADLVWKFGRGVTLFGSYAYTDAWYIQHQPEAFNGSSIPHIPEHSGRFWANYRFSQSTLNGLSFGVGVYAQTGVFLESLDSGKTEGFYSVDAAINYETQHIKLTAALKNITNKQHFESLNYLGGRLAPNQPISAYLSFSLRY